jgi:3D (Asp-Asp-Asp) domain-containing protein
LPVSLSVRALPVALITTLAVVGTAAERRARPRPPAADTLRVTATAYCVRGTTQSGARARSGVVAADPSVLPVGSVIRIVDGPHSGVYTVMDTGPAVKGRKIDIFMSSCESAEKFGAQKLRIRVLRRGWDPKASTDS